MQVLLSVLEAVVHQTLTAAKPEIISIWRCDFQLQIHRFVTIQNFQGMSTAASLSLRQNTIKLSGVPKFLLVALQQQHQT